MIQRGMYIAATLLGAVLGASPAWAVNDLSLVVSGSSNVRPGDAITVQLNVSNLAAPINGMQVLLDYNPAILDLVDIVPTMLSLTPPGQGWIEVNQSDAGGDIVYSIVIFNGSVSTNHSAATLQFDVIGEGSTSVSFRPDAPPFRTRLTLAADNTPITPTTANSGTIISACNDGVYCNGVEVFNGMFCMTGVDPCDDGVDCTVDLCNESNDSCTNTPNNALCSDGLFCNGTETCDALQDCQPGTNPCTDGVACTVDSCNEAMDSCTFTPNDALCDDLLYCTGIETCHPTLGCQAGVNPCPDAVACTVDICDEMNNVCVNMPNDAACDNGVFCDGAESCDQLLGCQPGTDPCAPLLCDETGNFCFAPLHITNVEVFYAGRFSDQADSSRRCLSVASSATNANITNYSKGITGLRIYFDNVATFASTPAAAFTFDWSTGSGTTFSPVTNAATMITVSEMVQTGMSVVTIVLADNHVARRWLRVTVNASQVTQAGVALDGELDGNPIAYPSGDGTEGGNAVIYLGNMVGDVDGDRKTLLTDVGSIRAAVNPFLSVPISTVRDVDKDGKVLLSDVGVCRASVNPFLVLPLISP